MSELYEERRTQYSVVQFTAETLPEVVRLLHRHGHEKVDVHFEPDASACITAKHRNGTDTKVWAHDYLIVQRTHTPPFQGDLICCSSEVFDMHYTKVETPWDMTAHIERVVANKISRAWDGVINEEGKAS